MSTAMSTVSPLETEALLIRCLASRWDGVDSSETEQWASQVGIDWPAIVVFAKTEGVASLLFAAIRQWSTAPASVRQQLNADYTHTAMRNTLLLHELTRILRQFAASNIDVIVLKGAALAESLYGNIALRPMVDLDLLVQPHAVQQVMALLATEGYHSTAPEVHSGTQLLFENEVLMVKAARTPVAVEVHWSLLDSPHHQQHVDATWFWNSAQTTLITGAQAQVLGPEAQLLHLCAHLQLHHRGEGLLWRHDVAALLQQQATTLDWPTVCERAQEFDLVIPVQTIVLGVANQWGITLPPKVETMLLAMQPSQREQQVYGWLTAIERPVLQRFWSDLRMLPSWRQRLRYALLQLFPTPAYMAERYHLRTPLLLPLAYPYRWLLGLWGWVSR